MNPVYGLIALIVLGLIGLFALPKKLGAGILPAESLGGISPAKYPYADLFKKWASKYNVDPDIVAAHGMAETKFDPNAINEEDPKLDYDSSYGLMQVQLATAQDFGAVVNYRAATPAEIAWLMDISNNIKVGAWNVARWQHKYPFDVAVQMYNTGERGYNELGRRAGVYLARVREAYNDYHGS
ncbi:MAG: transglycosylase SLT domain-containing protein [Candidatus Aminicenantes bacterium]|nr:transglycosylase SLT domain-containing protein [Candidatus Aminicenantes bacterium]